MSTIHNEAEIGSIATTVLMPGDPIRAEFIARNFLDDVKQVNAIRCAYCFTGKYNGLPVSVMASGMGTGSMGIYSYELFTHYNVDKIIRVGSAGSISKSLELGDIVVASASSSDSGYIRRFGLIGEYAPVADFYLMRKACEYMEINKISHSVGPVFCGSAFHYPNEFFRKWSEMGILAVEMESAALYINAAQTGKKALCLCTISDLIFENQSLPAKDRETTFSNMINTALSLI